MRKLYDEFTANYPKLDYDKLFVDYKNEYAYEGFIGETAKFIEDFQLLNPTLWKRFVNQFKEDADHDAGWRGEYWGKMMRGACFTYSYTKNPTLLSVLTDTVKDILTAQDKDGRISSYAVNHEFDGWDLWSRKYVLLGLQYFLEINPDEKLNKKIISSMKKQADYILDKIGLKSDGKIEITKATRHWRGLNSSSILEPIVRLYNITGEKRYFDFATYIVNTGFTDVTNFIDLAYNNEFAPYQYPVTKAYEMTSCFEGLLEYNRIVKNDKFTTALINYADRILETDFTVIGSAGCTHELFDHSTVRQTNTTNERIMQETCVTVTLMKFFYQMHLITGDKKYVDAFERAFYNAYLGSINTEKVIEPTILEEHPELNIEPLPFDSYSPLTAGTRGNGIGGLKIMSDNHYYGCCACIGSLGIGLVPKMQLLSTNDGFTYNLFINGTVSTYTPNNQKIVFVTKTDYPVHGDVKITIDELIEDEKFKILIRKPDFADKIQLIINDENLSKNAVKLTNGYFEIDKTWKNGDVIEIKIPLDIKAHFPIIYGEQILMNKVIWGANYMISTFDKQDPIAKNHIALQRGPIMLAEDSRLGYDVDEPISIKVDKNSTVKGQISQTPAPFKSILAIDVMTKDKKQIKLVDYSSAGKLMSNESKMAVWLLTK